MTPAPKRRWLHDRYMQVASLAFAWRVRRTLTDLKIAAKRLLEDWPKSSTEWPTGFQIRVFPDEPEVIWISRGCWRTTAGVEGFVHRLEDDGICFPVVAGNTQAWVEFHPDRHRPKTRCLTVGKEPEEFTTKYALERFTKLGEHWFLVWYAPDIGVKSEAARAPAPH